MGGVTACARRVARWLAAVLLVVGPGQAALAAGAPVGFQKIALPDRVTGQEFEVALWYPARAAGEALLIRYDLTSCSLPRALCQLTGSYTVPATAEAPPLPGRFGLIVISHGAGGGAMNHWDMAVALAAAGYIVAAPTHPRDANNDIAGATVWIGRPRQTSDVIDDLLGRPAFAPHIDPDRIGMLGHSNGGYTALALAGAQPSTQALTRHCRGNPDDRVFCAYGGRDSRLAAEADLAFPPLHDARIRAIALLAPVTALFTDATLASVEIPVAVYAASRDTLTPPASMRNGSAPPCPEQATTWSTGPAISPSSRHFRR